MSTLDEKWRNLQERLSEQASRPSFDPNNPVDNYLAKLASKSRLTSEDAKTLLEEIDSIHLRNEAHLSRIVELLEELTLLNDSESN